MKVINAANEVIIQYEDLFSDHPDGIDNSDARYINLTLTLGAPMKENQTYRWDSRVWDKLTKAELFVSAIVKVSSPKDLLGIKKESQGLTCENLFVLGDEPLTTNRVEDKQKLTFVFSGLKDFTLNSEKKVNLGASLIVKDANNFNLFEESDLFKDTTAYDPQRVETLYMYLTVGDPLLEGNVYTWHLKVWDKNSKKSISASVKLEVVK